MKIIFKKVMLFESIERHGADLPASADFHQLAEPLDVDKAVYQWVAILS
jgi:hypothetical protein